jgi:monoamine oxidase
MNTRRSFLRNILGGYLAAATTYACRAEEVSDTTEAELSDDHVYDCLILGGGMSGMAAANALVFPRGSKDTVNAKSRSVLVLEGQGQLGGRTKTVYNRDFGGPVELGAQYIHLDDEKGPNGARQSLWQAVREYGIRTSQVNRMLKGIAYSTLFEKKRYHWNIFVELPFLKLIRFQSDIENYKGPDMPSRQWVNKGPADAQGRQNTPFPDSMKPIVDIYLSGPENGPLEKMSLRGFISDRFSSLERGSHEYKVIEGWRKVYDHLKSPPPQLRSGSFTAAEVPVAYHTRVTNITYTPDGVTVSVQQRMGGKGGPAIESSPIVERTYRAKTAILTFPIGVLRKAVGIDSPLPVPLTFSPPLPARKIAAMRCIANGVGAKMFVAFEKSFWGDAAIINRVDGKSKMGKTYFISNYGEEANNYVLGTLLAGPEADRVATMSEDEILRGVCDELAEIYPEAHQEKAIYDRIRIGSDGKKAVLYKHWTFDPWAYCSDSYLEYGMGTREVPLDYARQQLASWTETPSLFWAGEATVYDDRNPEYAAAHTGFTHGAHASGIRAAKEVAAVLNKRG